MPSIQGIVKYGFVFNWWEPPASEMELAKTQILKNPSINIVSDATVNGQIAPLRWALTVREQVHRTRGGPGQQKNAGILKLTISLFRKGQ